MRLTFLICALLAFFQLVGCGPSSKENKSTKADSISKVQPAYPDMLSTDGELLLLSTYFGVCVRHAGVLRSKYDNGMPSPHFPTYAEFTGGAGNLKITVGRFDTWPDTKFKEVTATSLPRRIRIASLDGNKTLLVSDFEGAGKNRVSIDYDASDAEVEAEVIRMANNVIACHISAVSSKPKDR